MTEYSFAFGGCSDKLSRPDLEWILSRVGKGEIGPFSDAGSVAAKPGIVSNIDAIKPMTSDMEFYGRVSVLHAISDLHAVGAYATDCGVSLQLGRDRPLSDAVSILTGVTTVTSDHGILLGKGHSLWGDESILTISVLGNLAQQQEAPSDGTRYDLVLTKPLGGPRTLFLSEAGDSAMPRLAAIESILLVHANVSSLIARSVVGSTDVTGFGLAGALYELSDRGFDVSVCLKSLPVVSEEAFQIPVDCDTLSNERAFGQSIKGYQGTTFEKSRLFSSHYCGPIILLFNEGEGDAACGTLRANGFNDARVIGSVIKRHCGNICVV